MRQFYTDVLAIVESYPVGTKFTSDTIRKDAVLRQAAPPQHENGWGNALSMASQRGLDKRTNRYFPSDIPSSHGRRIAEWERI